VWLGFQGGKGVAPYIGVLIGMHWPAALWFGIIWAGVALGSRYSSLAALSAVVGVVLYYFVTGWAGLPFILIMSALVFLKHHANIRRLLEGRENKIGARS
jgi:glycerol-3-phosphate acyltransferase PlsY